MIKQIEQNCQIWTFRTFYRESLKAIDDLPVCVNMRIAKHHERIVKIKKLSEIGKSEPFERVIVKISKVPNNARCVRYGVRNTTSVSLVVKEIM